MGLSRAAPGGTALTGTGLTSMAPNGTGLARTEPSSTGLSSTGLSNSGPRRQGRPDRRSSGQERSPRTRSRRENQARRRTGREREPMARPGSRILAPARVPMRQAGTRTDRAQANSDQGTRGRTGPATRTPATVRPRRAGPEDAEDPGQWGRAVLDSLARVLVSPALGIPVAVRTVRDSPDPAGTALGRPAVDAERAGRAVSRPRRPRRPSRPKGSPSQAAGRAVSAIRRATGSIPAPARPDRGIGQAAP
jgi:hypothetical protein